MRCLVSSVGSLVDMLAILGVIPSILGIMLLIYPIFLFRRVRHMQRVGDRFPMSFPYWRRTNKSLNAIKKQPSRGWLDWTARLKKSGKNPLRLKLFDNAALFLFWEVGGIGQKLACALVIDRMEAARCQLSPGKNGEEELTSFAASADCAVRSIPIPPPVAKCWTDWVAGTAGQKASP